MEPRIISIFPVDLTIYQLTDTALINDTVKDLEKEAKVNVSSYDQTTQVLQTKDRLHKDQKYKQIISWITDRLNDFKNHYSYQCESFEITSCWANLSPAHSYATHQLHYHPMSFISGILYLTDGSPTYFRDPVVQRNVNSMKLSGNPKLVPDTYGLLPDVGKLVLFPSWLEHGTIMHRLENYNRLTISFNAIPTGACNYSEDGTSGLNTWNIKLND